MSKPITDQQIVIYRKEKKVFEISNRRCYLNEIVTISSDTFDLHGILQQFTDFVYVVHFERGKFPKLLNHATEQLLGKFEIFQYFPIKSYTISIIILDHKSNSCTSGLISNTTNIRTRVI